MNTIIKWIGAMAIATVLVSAVLTTQSAQAGTFTTLHLFCPKGPNSQSICLDGNGPTELVQATNGDFYGTTQAGGTNGGYGTVFKITPGGKLTTLHSFDLTDDGDEPQSGLIQATNGDLYGTTYSGGSTHDGTVFKITLGGTLTTLHSFPSTATDGENPWASLIQPTEGVLYGTTQGGGAYGGTGAIFKIALSGTRSIMHSFCLKLNSNGYCADGNDILGGLIQGTDGNFYGTTGEGGTNGRGTVFKITPSGKLTTLYNFCAKTNCTDGEFPVAGLIQATDGNFYGTTWFGGANDNVNCDLDDYAGCGTIFKITPDGMLTTLYSFCAQTNCTDGIAPFTAALIQATDGNLYGTTEYGGAYGAGTVFKITLDETLTTLHSFCNPANITPDGQCADDGYPIAGLIQATDGNFYGTTLGYAHVSAGYGSVFRMSEGLSPFVETQTTSGMVGAAVKILGTDLTGATSVTFNGTSATFTVNSTGTVVTTTVPMGATTGTVQVVTPTATLNSNTVFTVN